MRWLALIIAIVLSAAVSTRAQTLPSNVDVLLGTHAVLHTADMITTSYDLTLGRAVGANELNPMLRPFSRHPSLLVGMSSAIDVLEAHVIKQVERTHPRWALVWSAALVGVEVWATTNNIATAGKIQQRRLAASR
jgi:hypothetical protein